MLAVHRDSWHYRIWQVGRPHSHRPRNLCRYFWYIALIVAICLLIVGLALAGIAGLVFVLVTNPVDFLIGVGITLAICATVIGAIWVISMLIDREEARKERIRLGLEQPPAPKEPGVVRSFLKAKKEKYCPLIKVVDD